MRATTFLKKLFLFNLIFTFSSLICAVSVKAQRSEWKSSEKKDNIETLYQVEKVGTDSFEVTIKIKNNRSKEVKIETAVLYKTEITLGSRSSILTIESDEHCKESIPSNGSRTCKPIQVNAKKIIGAKIICWNNTDGKPCSDGRLPRRPRGRRGDL